MENVEDSNRDVVAEDQIERPRDCLRVFTCELSRRFNWEVAMSSLHGLVLDTSIERYLSQWQECRARSRVLSPFLRICNGGSWYETTGDSGLGHVVHLFTHPRILKPPLSANYQ